MKNYLLSLATIVACMLTVSSCDEDERIADSLAGGWRGVCPCFVVGSSTPADSTYILFERDYVYSKTGKGCEVDFFGSEAYFTNFRWEIDYNTLYLRYDSVNAGMDCDVNYYMLDDKIDDEIRHFVGQLDSLDFDLQTLPMGADDASCHIRDLHHYYLKEWCGGINYSKQPALTRKPTVKKK